MTALGLGLDAARPANVRYLNGASERAKFVGRLVEYIPADVVAGYTAVYALVPKDDASYLGERVTLLFFLLLAPLLVAGPVVLKHRRDNNGAYPVWKQYPRFRMFVAPAAFAAWSFSLPGSPVTEGGSPPGWLQTLVLVGTTLLLALLGQFFDDVKAN